MQVYTTNEPDDEKRSGKDLSPERIRLIAAVLTLVAAVFGFLKRGDVLAWGILAVALLLLAAPLGPAAVGRIGRRAQRLRGVRLLRELAPEFMRQVRTFGRFVDNTRSDNLWGLLRTCPDLIRILPDLELFSSHQYYFAGRAVAVQCDPAQFLQSVQEFDTCLVRTYNNHCVVKLFDRLPETAWAGVPANMRADLAAFRERWVLFSNDYTKFLEQLQEHFPEVRLYPGMPQPRPVIGSTRSEAG